MGEKGSVQLRRYLLAREHGHTRADSAPFAGIELEEARLIDIDKGFVASPQKVVRGC